MDMEDLLCPQISMDVDETPLQLGSKDDDKDDTGSTTSEDMPLDVKIKILLEVEEFDAAQIPSPLTEEEEALKKTVFNLGPAVQFMRLHCTSCNVHIGSAPVNQFNRFIHPLLHVLLCKKCYDFYSSGEFEKDEDGSELYCRWCGQGGKVMCCSDCCYVFCQKCVRVNLGKKTLDGIKNSDDWRCFVCNPQQLINLKLICHSLYHYILNEIRIAKETKMDGNLIIDHSMCCKPNNRPPKRKRSTSVEDSNYQPGSEFFVKKMKNVLKTAMTSFTPESTNGQLGVNPAFRPMGVPPVRGPGMPILNKYLKVKPMGNRARFPILKSRPTPVITSFNKNPIMANQLTRPVAGTQNFIPSYSQPIQVPPSNSASQVTPVVNCVPAKLLPGTKHNWFEQAATITTNITNQLNRKLATFSAEQKKASSIEQLAGIHNKLQELLSSSVNSLIHVRKNLRNEFLNDLNKIKYAKKSEPPPSKNTQIQLPPAESVPTIVDDDDDVIIINNEEEDPLATHTPEPIIPPPTILPPIEHDPNKPRTFLKVKPVASLMEASRLPPPEKIPEQIDLCDDDDDEGNPDTAKEVLVISEIESAIPEKSPGIDFETSRQIKRALSESKFEAVVEDNLKIKVVPGLLTQKQIKRMITVRVIVDPKWIPKRKLIVPEPESQDVEDIIEGTVVINKSVIRDTGDGDSKVSSDEEIVSSDNNKVAEISSDEEEYPKENNDSNSMEGGEMIGINDIDANRIHDIDDDSVENTDAIGNVSDKDKAMDVDDNPDSDEVIPVNNDSDKTSSTNIVVDETVSTNDEVNETTSVNGELAKTSSTTNEIMSSIDVNNEAELAKDSSTIEGTSLEKENEEEELNDSSNADVRESLEVEKSPPTELNHGSVHDSDSENVNNFSDDFNPFRNAENGDAIYDRRKEPESNTDKVTEFEVSTDPVTTTDSGIEVDAK